MKQMNGRGKLVAVVLSIFAAMMIPQTVCAADVKILETNVYEDDIYIYVKGISEVSSDTVIQIGNTTCRSEQISASTFEQMNPYMRTVILVDNSKSIPEKNHADIQEILKGIISNSRKNEQIKIGTFSRETAYLCDYTSDHVILENVINNISYNDQDTYLSDVLYHTISELKTDDTFVCTRVIILSDGADDNFIGYPNDEVRRYIESNQFPVYTIGISRKNNASQLETMFSFSRAAHTDFFLLDGSVANEEVVNAILTDQSGICLKITPDESLKDGSDKGILLKLSTAEGIFELKTSVEMPFGDVDLIQPAPESESSTVFEEPDSTIPSIGPTPDSAVPDSAGTHKKEPPQGYLWIFMLLLTIIAALITVIIILRRTRRKGATPPPPPVPQPAPQVDDTFIPGSHNDPYRESEKELWGDKLLVLRNLDLPNVFFKVPIKDVVCIGRLSTQDIVISDDNQVSREHCKISLRGGLMYLRRCEKKNGTYYENVLVPEDHEIPIVSGGKIKMGQYQYCVELVDQ